MRIANDVTALVGNTPLVRIRRLGEGAPGQVVASSSSTTRPTASRTGSGYR
jgi:hypothetical protein